MHVFFFPFALLVAVEPLKIKGFGRGSRLHPLPVAGVSVSVSRSLGAVQLKLDTIVPSCIEGGFEGP